MTTSRRVPTIALLVLLAASLACETSTPATAPTAPIAETSPAPPTQAPQPPAPVDLTAGLIAYYPFDGDTLDASGRGHDGQQAGPEFVPDAAGKPDSALFFDSVDTVLIVDAADLDLTGSFTISMHILGAENQEHQWLLAAKHTAGQCQPASPSWFLRYSKPSGGLYISLYDQSAECGTHFGYGTEVPLDDGKWHSLLVSYDRPAQLLRYYFDCQIVFEQIVDLNFQDNTQPLTFGNQYYGPESTNFNGILDEIRIYDLALEDARIQAVCAGR